MSLCSTFTSGSPSPIELKPIAYNGLEGYPRAGSIPLTQPPGTSWIKSSTALCLAHVMLQPHWPSDSCWNLPLLISRSALQSLQASGHLPEQPSLTIMLYSPHPALILLHNTSLHLTRRVFTCLFTVWLPLPPAELHQGWGFVIVTADPQSWVELNLAHGRLSTDSL